MKKLRYFMAVACSVLVAQVALAGSGQPPPASVSIQNFAFSPSTITVMVGTSVTWTNRDSTAHTVTGNTAGGPSSAQIPSGQSYSFAFTKTGSYPYHCSIHPYMTGMVNVVSSMSGTSAGASGAPPATTNPGKGGGTQGQGMQMQMPASGSQTNSNLPDTGSNQWLDASIIVLVLGLGVLVVQKLRKSRQR